MTKSYVFTPNAGQHLKDVWRYTKKEWGRDQATKYANQIKNALEYLSKTLKEGV